MNDVASNSGRTVLFVSHNMNSVRALCKHGVVLKNGMVEMVGTADECVDFYMETSIDKMVGHTIVTPKLRKVPRDLELEYKEVRMHNDPVAMSTDEPLQLEMKVHRNKASIREAQFGIFISNTANVTVDACYTEPVSLPDGTDDFIVKVTLPSHHLAKGAYKIDMNISRFDYQAFARDYDLIYDALSFEVKYVDAAHKQTFTAWPRNLGSVIMRDAVVKVTNA